jgi:hypothetical protein
MELSLDDDGLETYVRRAIAANEVVWFPAIPPLPLIFFPIALIGKTIFRVIKHREYTEYILFSFFLNFGFIVVSIIILYTYKSFNYFQFYLIK